MVGVSPESNGYKLDGIDQLHALQSDETIRKSIFLGYSNNQATTEAAKRSVTIRQRRSAALRFGDWKIIRDPQFMQKNEPKWRLEKSRSQPTEYALHNLRYDPGETVDLSKEEPDLLASLIQQLKEHEDEMTNQKELDKRCTIDLKNQFALMQTEWGTTARRPWCIDSEAKLLALNASMPIIWHQKSMHINYIHEQHEAMI
jgi:arylsulfatase A-like enzyme